MPWQERHTMSLRREFVEMARQEGANVRALCRHFEISPKTAYKWLSRFDADDPHCLSDRSRQPLHWPARSAQALEQQVVALRQEHPAWGGRKIARRLQDLGGCVVAPSTVTSILHRHGLIVAGVEGASAPLQRFEHERPNSLWQIDFKGRFSTLEGACHPLTLLDDHSRFNLALQACIQTSNAQVQPLLQAVFRRYGIPVRINADNGAPWGSSKLPEVGLSQLTIWLIRLGIRVSHSRPYHPQTNGKLERFHRSMQAEVLAGRNFTGSAQAQRAFDRWREVYNLQRPHEALAMHPPISRYRPSTLAYPEQLPAIEYADGDTVVQPNSSGFIRFKGRSWRISQALGRLPVGIRQHPGVDGLFDVFFCHHRCAQLDMRTAETGL